MLQCSEELRTEGYAPPLALRCAYNLPQHETFAPAEAQRLKKQTLPNEAFFKKRSFKKRLVSGEGAGPFPPEAQSIMIGTDIIEIERIARALQRHGEEFEKRIFTQQERAYCRARPRPESSFAARFAAKEAVSKALGVGIGAALGWQSISVGVDAHGAPQVSLDAKGQALLKAKGKTQVHISLSHSRSLAQAFALLA